MVTAAVCEEAQPSSSLESELDWFWRVLSARVKAHFDTGPALDSLSAFPPPSLTRDCPYGRYVLEHGFSAEERLILSLALSVHLKPQLLDVFFTKNATFDRRFTEFGGVHGEHHSGFQPTGETALFLLAGEDLAARLRHSALLETDAPLRRSRTVVKDTQPDTLSRFGGRLRIPPQTLDLLLWGRASEPGFGADFPARRIETQLSFEELVLEPNAMRQVMEIRSWVEHGRTLLGELGLARTVKPGYRSLFCGPPGTGKTLTAALLGGLTQRPVYRVDLSLIVSKYIGETEKNLETVFTRAEEQDWILFFDEADALFGKRSAIHDAHDKYANQEVSYLLQRVEDYPNVVILASNMKENLDEAFVRRFQSIIYFPLPQEGERLRLWQAAFSPQTALAGDLKLRQIAERYELSGGGISNVVRFATLQALAAGTREITHKAVVEGIEREYHKAGKAL